MKRGPGPQRKTALGRSSAPLSRSKGLTRGSGPREPQTASQRVVFKARTPARVRRCAICNRQARAYHHAIPQQVLRRHVSGLRLPEPDARRTLRRLLRDERNLVPTCVACHGDQEQPGVKDRPIRLRHLPDSFWEFADELGEWARVRAETLYAA